MFRIIIVMRKRSIADKTILSENQVKQVTGAGDTVEMIPRTDNPICPNCKSENVELISTLFDSKTKRRKNYYKCKKCEHIFLRETYDID